MTELKCLTIVNRNKEKRTKQTENGKVKRKKNQMKMSKLVGKKLRLNVAED